MRGLRVTHSKDLLCFSSACWLFCYSLDPAAPAPPEGVEQCAAALQLFFRIQYLTRVGAIAQLGERLHGMQEVGGSIPPGSTTLTTTPSGNTPWPDQ